VTRRTSSHVKCRGQYEGCLKTAHRGSADSLCTPCREHTRVELAEKGVKHGKLVMPPKKLDQVLDEVVGPRMPGHDRELFQARSHILTENVIADAETGGHGVLSPEERFQYAAYVAVRSDTENALAYLSNFRGSPPGTVLVGDPNLVPYDQRVEIRELHRSGAAERAELLSTYTITDACLDKILAEPDAPEPEELAVAVAEPTQEARNRTVEHMQKMREARARKKAEQEEKAERDRLELALLQGRNNGREEPREPFLGGMHQEVSSDGPAWSVTILQPTVVTVHAATLAAAMVEAQNRYRLEPEQILGIVKE
jgi:hypothetical protein